MDAVSIARDLIALNSVTSGPNQAVSQYTRAQLERLHFEVREVPYVDAHGTNKTNLLAVRKGRHSALGRTDEASHGGGIAFFCHTDVVSVDGWSCSHGGPFDGAVAENRLWGRGACDMKGPIAAALCAFARIDHASQSNPIYFIATGDEECGMVGAQRIAEQCHEFAEIVTNQAVGVIGEPTSLQVVNAHKGGCHLDVSSRGVAAHSSTAEGKNANWQLIPFLNYLGQVAIRCETDPGLQNRAFEPATLSLNIVVENQPRSPNITVSRATCQIFFRPMPDTAWQSLLDEIRETATTLQLAVNVLPELPPMHTPAEREFVKVALRLLNQDVPHAVSYATDGCCFTELKDLIVIGPGNIAQAHRPDEWIDIDQLQLGVDVYETLFRRYAVSG